MAERKRFLLDEIVGQRQPNGIPIPIFSDTGFTTRPRNHALGINFGNPDPAWWNVDFDDFTMRYASADWTVTLVGTGTNARVAGNGGLLALTNSAAGADSTSIQRPVAAFRPVTGLPVCGAFRFQVDNAANADVVVGLHNADTTPFSDPTDGLWFKKSAGATFSFIVSKASTQSVASAIATPADATFISLEFAYDGVNVFYGVNGVIVGSLTGVNLPNTVDLAPSLAVRNNTAVARTLTVDYFMCAQYRG